VHTQGSKIPVLLDSKISQDWDTRVGIGLERSLFVCAENATSRDLSFVKDFGEHCLPNPSSQFFKIAFWTKI